MAPVKRIRKRRRRFDLDSLEFGPIEKARLGFLVVLIVILTGGGMNLLSQTLGVALIGIWLLISPPRHAPNPFLLSGALLLLVYPLLTLVLPQLGKGPDWLVTASATYGIESSGVWSLQPAGTLEVWPLILAGVGWLFITSDPALNHDLRRLLVREYCVMIGALGLFVFVGQMMGIIWVFAPEAQGFSLFNNRNQTANLLAIGAFVSAALCYESFRYKRDWGFVGLVLLIVLLAALFQIGSRSGIVLFLLGILIWFALKTAVARQAHIIKIGVPLVLLIFSGFLFFGADTRDRLLGEFSSMREGVFDFRLAVYSDTMTMLGDWKGTGVGAGNFAEGFVHYRDASARAEPILHPESDLLWVVAEMGIPGLIAVALLLYGMFLVLRLKQLNKASPYRIIILVAGILFCIHGLFDVSGHRLGTVMAILLLLGFTASKEGKDSGGAPALSIAGRWVFRVSGILLCATAGFWGVSMVGGLPFHSSQYPEQVSKEVFSSDNLQNAIDRSTNYLKAYPLDWRGYFGRARATLASRTDLELAVDDFRRARFLNPMSPAIAYAEGQSWMGISDNRAMVAFREALRRPPDALVNLEHQLIRDFEENPRIQSGLLDVSVINPSLRGRLLMKLAGDRFAEEMEIDMQSDPKLAQFEPAMRENLLRRWAQTGQAGPLLALLEAHPDLVENSWQLRAVALAVDGSYRDAISLVREKVNRPAVPSLEMETNLVRLEREYRANPQDLMKGSTLLNMQIEAKRWAQALQTLRLMSRYPEAPSYVYYWIGEIYFMQDDLEASWRAFDNFLRRQK